MENIDPIDGPDKLRAEIQEYQVDEDITLFESDLEYVEYWSKVKNITEGLSGWNKYEILPLFAVGLGSKFNSNSDVERKFSEMNIVHQNKQRNCLAQDTLNSILDIRSGVECKKIEKVV